METPDATVGFARRQLAQLPANDYPVEHARALNLLGAALRDAGELAEAREAFTRAAELFAEHDLPLEVAAAVHNRALVARDAGDHAAAVTDVAAAGSRFEQAGARGHAGACARELGTLELERGDIDAALAALAKAVTHAEAAGDLAGLGVSENVRGLASLAVGRLDDAVKAFQRSAGGHPRTVRPDGYAMAKANLALAYERQGDEPRARLAARQALGAPVVPEPVGAQASELLTRLGEQPDDLHVVLDGEPPERWVAVLREEVAWWAGAAEDARAAHLGAWLDGVVVREQVDRLGAWLEVLLELAPGALVVVIQSTMAALSQRSTTQQRHARELFGRAVSRFPLPQWQRLAAAFERAATQAGVEPGWR